ncbi:hypothetical protein [Wenyingzhuangia sp. IMCC45467]
MKQNIQIESLDTEELIIIVLFPTIEYSNEIVENTKKELLKRKITESRLSKIDLIWSNRFNKKQFKDKIKNELNKTESYSVIEMFYVIVLGTIFFLKPYLSPLKSLKTLKKEGFYLKYKQKIFLIAFGYLILFLIIGNTIY